MELFLLVLVACDDAGTNVFVQWPGLQIWELKVGKIEPAKVSSLIMLWQIVKVRAATFSMRVGGHEVAVVLAKGGYSHTPDK